MIDLTKHNIVISPIGDLDTGLIRPIGTEINRIFSFQTRIESLTENIDFAFDQERRQYHSTPILEQLAELAAPGTFKIIAVTEVDLFIPILTYVYGEAQLGGRACIVSTSRLQEGLPAIIQQKIFSGRVIKEAIHELGHTFNLRHCKDRSCIMHYCRNIKDVDRKLENLCRYCKVLLNDDLKRLGIK